jgi:hypothetical protein
MCNSTELVCLALTTCQISEAIFGESSSSFVEETSVSGQFVQQWAFSEFYILHHHTLYGLAAYNLLPF